ncbi:MAG: GDSL-type esterase/lipase family protein, partial [Actinomycetes bacterium]
MVGTAILWVVMMPVAVLVAAAWLLHRLVGHDPLRGPASSPGGWVERASADLWPARYYSSAVRIDDRPTSARLAAAAGPILLVALIAAGVVWWRTDRPSTPPVRLTEQLPTRADCAAQASGDEPGSLECDTAAALGHLEFWAPSVYRIADIRSATVNEVNGERRSWRPPASGAACSGSTPLNVWWFGGSAAWGEGQRDAHTLPSNLARAACRRGIAVEIHNFAQPMYTMGQEVRLYADLISRRQPPDLVVFYNGANDLTFQGLRARYGRATDSSPIILQEQQLDALLARGFPVDPAVTTTTSLPPAPVLTDALVEQTTDAAMVRYGADVRLARQLSDAAGVPVVVVWQPVLATAPEGAGGPTALDASERGVFERLFAAARRKLPAGVVDAGDALDGASSPVFVDLFHTNEAGARVAANWLLRSLDTRLRDAQRVTAQPPPEA